MDDRSYSDAAHLFADVVEKLPQMHRPLYLAMVAQELEGMMKAADAIFAQGMSLAALGGGVFPVVPGAEVWADAVRRTRVLALTLTDHRLSAGTEEMRRPVMLAVWCALEQLRGCLDVFAGPRATVMEAMRGAKVQLAEVRGHAAAPMPFNVVAMVRDRRGGNYA